VLLGWIINSLPLSYADQTDLRPAPQIDILAVDDRAYPDVYLYLTVVDRNTGLPIPNLNEANFFITTNNDNRLEPQGISTSADVNRPVHLMVVLDLTSSVSPTEFTHMRDAAALLVASLGAQDHVGVIIMDHEQSQLIQPLSPDQNAALNAMSADDLSPVENRSGNVVADGIYQAVEALVTPSPDVRPTVVVFTDVPANSIGGRHNLDEVRVLAQQRGTTIHVVYFETETNTGDPSEEGFPVELELLANDTGGIALQHEGETVGDESVVEYDDDDRYLVEMAQQIADIVEQEYRITLEPSFTADDQLYPISVAATVQGVISSVSEASFRARSGFVNLSFSNVENGQRVQLPVDLQVDISADNDELRSLALYRIDETSGTEILISNLSIDNPSFTLTSDMVSSSLLTLKLSGTDLIGNTGERFITLVVEGLDESGSNGSNLTRSSEESGDESDIGLVEVGLIVVIAGGLSAIASGVIFWRLRRSVIPVQQAPSSPPPIPAPPLPTKLSVEPSPPPPDPVWTDPFEAQTMTEDDLGLVVKAFLVGANDEQYPLYEGENTIGRHGTNMVQIMDSTSSRYHAVIEIHGDVYDYVDWRSTQPSVINGQPLAMNEHYSLKDGDQIKIGMTVLRFVIHQ
jgi:hypothetical protein